MTSITSRSIITVLLPVGPLAHLSAPSPPKLATGFSSSAAVYVKLPKPTAPAGLAQLALAATASTAAPRVARDGNPAAKARMIPLVPAPDARGSGISGALGLGTRFLGST